MCRTVLPPNESLTAVNIDLGAELDRVVMGQKSRKSPRWSAYGVNSHRKSLRKGQTRVWSELSCSYILQGEFFESSKN
jgi:hypothetical protein